MTYKIPHLTFQAKADPEAVICHKTVRFTILSERLFRLEFDPDKDFQDSPSQAFWYRKQPVPHYKVEKSSKSIEINTAYLQLIYRVNDEGFTSNTLSIRIKATGTTWKYGDANLDNLKGTGRTLDGADGAIPLENGLMSRSGWAVIDDSTSLIFNDNDWLEPRKSVLKQTNAKDLYFFGFGHDYKGCLKEYCKISGKVPLIPRWALGNWWSRYWEYNQEELTQLIQDFRKYEIPLSICIIDMDWHITKTGNTSSGWTGYTWNRELFPDPWKLVDWLHQQGLKTAMNLHPADGIHPHEADYPQIASYMDIDPKTNKPVPFDIADPQFTKGYFEILHHSQEEKGIDFWWMDWQQGQRIQQSRTELGKHLDPLWWLNHLHYHDRQRDGLKRGFIFSRWGGLGNHRYPIGFSGDSIVTWASLAFQPYFTATASNVAFGWWSHDIGGHYNGMENAELFTRWVQFGIFSPIFRLHCTKNPYQDRRPWAFSADVLNITRQYMQLRHRFIPYIYTMSWRFTQDDLPLITPMYYDYPEYEEAYHCPDQYFFGSELIAAPFVSERDPHTNMSRQTVWLPEGDWFDFFSGEYYRGGRWTSCYGTLEETLLFAHAGSIIPMGATQAWGGVDNPVELDIQVFAGADGSFILYEDDGEGTAYIEGQNSRIQMIQSFKNNELSFKINKAIGNDRHIPSIRKINLQVWGLSKPDTLEVRINGALINSSWIYNASSESLHIPGIMMKPSDDLELYITNHARDLLSKRDRKLETARKFLRTFSLANAVKAQIDSDLESIIGKPQYLTKYAHLLKDSQFATLSNLLS